MDKGWTAKGLLAPLWSSLGGRDGLAAATGIPGTTLSAYNSGKRPLGRGNADRIAEALGVSILDLGAPIEAVDEAGQSLLDRLLELAATVDDQQSMIEGLESRLAKLERGPSQRRRATGAR